MANRKLDYPLFSVITPVYNPPVSALLATIESVRIQTFADWELVLVDDSSTSPGIREVLDDAAARDSRIRVVRRSINGGIVAASNDALGVAQGSFVALLDHDDRLAEHALGRMALEITADPEVDYLYSDEDKLDPSGRNYDRFDKPGWSPERLRGQMYTGHLSVFRADMVRAIGGFRRGYEGSQDHDLVLRATEVARRIVHVPEVLYHWCVVEGSTAADIDNKPYAWDAGVRAVADHLARTGIDATAQPGPVPGTYRIARTPELEKSVSIIIPTRGTTGVVWGERRVFIVEAVRSLLGSTRHRDVEIIVVYDSDTPSRVLDELRMVADGQIVLVPFDADFNFSRKCNEGYFASRGDILFFVNDDVEVISDELIGMMAAPLREADVGMTGAKLFFEDGAIQHAGHLHHMGQFTHAYLGEAAESFGSFSSLLINREASGLTAACIAIRRDVFQEVGGFSELFPGNFNDVDLCKKVTESGYRLLWLSDAKLYHFESRSRNPMVKSFEHKLIIDRWGGPGRDPYLA